MILEIGTENIVILLQDNYICVQKNGEIIKSIPLRDIRAVMVYGKKMCCWGKIFYKVWRQTIFRLLF